MCINNKDCISRYKDTAYNPGVDRYRRFKNNAITKAKKKLK